MNTSHKGYLALDIDGTVTAHQHEIPQKVREFLKSLHSDGWKILFITGRTFSYGVKPLLALDFPYFLAVQNGADILSMPERKTVFRSYLNKEIIEELECIYKEAEEDFLVYAGYDEGDFCYYRTEKLSPSLKAHIEEIKQLSKDPWIQVHSFSSIPKPCFSLIKCFGSPETMERIQKLINADAEHSFSVIRNPFSIGGDMGLLTAKEASKGHAVEWIVSSFGHQLPVISAGNDRNDIPMLEKADLAIVMEDAPTEVLQLADIIAPSAEKEGIILGITQAIENL